MKRLNSYSMLFALIISTLIFGITHLVLANTLLYANSSLRIVEMVQSGLNAESAVYFAINNLETGETRQIQLFEDKPDHAIVTKKPWGAFTIVSGRTQFAGLNTTKSVLCGSQFDTKTVLSLAESNLPLSVSGRTYIEGNCELPKAGVKRAYIEGKHFIGNKIINGVINNSLTNQNKSSQLNFNKWNFIQGDSIAFLDEVGDSVFNPFSNPTFTIVLTEGEKRLSGWFKGNIVIRSENNLEIGRDCTLEDVIVTAKEINLLPGFLGAGQFIAEEAINIEGCYLTYPSIVGVIHKHKSKQQKSETGVSIKTSRVEGGVLFSEEIQSRNPAGITIGKHTQIIGLVESNSWVELKGKVKGRINTNNFLLRTPSSVYKNHLLDATITTLSEVETLAFVTKEGEPLNIIKWVD